MLRLAALSLLLCSVAVAEEVKVQVLRDGKPAKGAVVRVGTSTIVENRFKYEFTEPVKVDDTGKVTLTYTKTPYDFSLIATHPDGLIGSCLTRERGRGPKPEVYTITLVKTAMGTGKLLDTEGKPIAGAELSARIALIPLANKEDWQNQVVYQLDGLKEYNSKTDDQGKFKFANVPEGSWVDVDYRSAKLGSGNFRISTDKSFDIKLPTTGSLKMVFDSAEAKHGDWDIYLQPTTAGDFQPGTVSVTRTLDKESGVYSGVMPGKYTLRLERRGSSPRIPEESKEPIEIKSSEQTVLNIKTTPAAILTGRLVEKGTDKGLAGIRVSIQGTKPRIPVSATTDKDGKYTLVVPGDNDFLLYINSPVIVGDRHFLRPTPDPKEGPRNNSLVPKATIKPGDKHEFPTLEIREALTIRGKVVRADGKPILSRCELFCSVDGVYDTTNNITWDGANFTLKGMPQDIGLTLRVRNGTAVNVPETIDAKKLKEPVTLTISEANSVSLTGKIIDLKERGLNGVKVELEWSRSIEGSEGSSTHTMVATTKTVANGEYVFTGMWPNERYFVSAEDPRFGKAGGDFNKTRRAESGGTIEYDTFTVKVAEAAITGTVLHLDGTPVVGATVQTTGDTPKTMTTTTDANGKFEIKNLPNTKLFVTATKAGYRHTYAPCDTSKGTAALVLRKQSEDPAPIKSEDLDVKRKNATHEMLELLWVTRANHGWGPRTVEFALRFNEKLVQKWIEQAPPKEAEGLKSQLASNLTNDELVTLALRDIDAAINNLKKLPYNVDYQMCQLGEKLVSTDKASAVKLAEAALGVLRSQKQTNKGRYAATLARPAALLQMCGQEAEAKKLFKEALDLVAESEKDPNDQYSRSWVAEQLGKVDLPAAIEQFKIVKDDYHQNTSFTRLLVFIAKTDPQKALDNLKNVRKEYDGSFRCAEIPVAVAIADREPARAIKLIQGLKHKREQVRGYMELARKMNAKDEKTAWELIDKAFDALENGADDFESSSNFGGRMSAAAQVASVARQINHPDVHTLISRTLAYRGKDRFPSVDSLNGRLHYFLMGLSVADPEAVRWVLNSKYTEDELLSKSTGQRNLLFILAMVDPALCKKAVEQYMANVKKVGFGNPGIIELLGSLTTKGKEFESLGDWQALFFSSLERE